MIIYGDPNDHLWTNPDDFGPSPCVDLVIIYGVARRTWQNFSRPRHLFLPGS
jgi:hypothetical protein